MNRSTLGAVYHSDRSCAFTLWAPLLKQAAVHLVAPEDRLIPMTRDERGYWRATVTGIDPGVRYFYQWNGEIDRPDPASHSQPQGVHGPSAVVDHAFAWSDAGWRSLPLAQWVMYELHIGTFTPEGTFDAIIPRLPELRELGVNALELMPVAQFPGQRNWGYDGVYPYAVQHSYGGVAGLKRLVDACHREGLAVIMDVVYNHLGPEGNYLWGLGTYFTDRYRTPWGDAVNYDGPHSPGVREYMVENVRYWFETCHCDALRLDAVHAIYDFGARHILAELAEAAAHCGRRSGRSCHLIAESDLNDPRLIRSPDIGGYGLDAQWSDDFHHALHTVLTGERHGYYEDFGALELLAQAYCQPFVYAGDYSAHRQRFHGADAADCPAWRFVVCSQNHDQVGNRALGERLSGLLPFPALKLAAAAVLLSPYLPLLFMGEEYGELRPFQYFISHGDPALIENVREGRKQEFMAFHAAGEAPDPQSEATFQGSKLQWELRQTGQHGRLRAFYRELLRLRRELPALTHLDNASLTATVIAPGVLELRRWCNESRVAIWMNFAAEPATVTVQPGAGAWRKQLDAADSVWGGDGSALPMQWTDGNLPNALMLPAYAVVVYIAER
ncbi:MAG TPA: malto-oligosyltrehalose trehalohydrolase [Candidatus Competibacteraceae bacterium]|nr:malto-oligosyltrehalose trehalohydrolase [Candidatus Competibacteraceae bacterium]HRZ06301.1 malto-oligosyltrehalose trehalohydrolase [Candidatus Competibacteraceae bacterium]HSA45491.1 malto-oligosyltrehalose trehalohydrolase [Candidatus Competibacteraceae bacterium]